MELDPSKVAFWWPAGLKRFKELLFAKVADGVKRNGGMVVKHDHRLLERLPDDVVPIVGCHPPLKDMISVWRSQGRKWAYWDRGYAVRLFSTWLKRPTSGSGYYRWEVGAFQMKTIRKCGDDRWKSLGIETKPWAKGGRHIVVAMPTQPYSAFHGTERWTDQTVEALNKLTDRPIMIRSKESKRHLWEDLKGAHALVSHGSNAANEAIIFGCPVFTDKSCAAALVGKTDICEIEKPIYPDRQPWLNSLAYSQFSESELTDRTLWRLIA